MAHIAGHPYVFNNVVLDGNFDEVTIHLPSGEAVVVYSSGIIETWTPKALDKVFPKVLDKTFTV